MKIKLLWAVIAVFIALVVGFIGRGFISPAQSVTATNWVAGNKTNWITSFVTMTNSISNSLAVYYDYTRYSTDPFKFVQVNDTMTVYLYKRNAQVKIKNRQDGVIAGGGWNLSGYPVALVGYHFSSLLFAGTVGIGTNINLQLLAAWLF